MHCCQFTNSRKGLFVNLEGVARERLRDGISARKHAGLRTGSQGVITPEFRPCFALAVLARGLRRRDACV